MPMPMRTAFNRAAGRAIAACVAYCRDHPPWRVSLQTHKLLRIP